MQDIKYKNITVIVLGQRQTMQWSTIWKYQRGN